MARSRLWIIISCLSLSLSLLSIIITSSNPSTFICIILNSTLSLRKFIIANLLYIPSPPYIATATTSPSETAVLLFFHFFSSPRPPWTEPATDRPPVAHPPNSLPPSISISILSLPTRAGALSLSRVGPE